MWGKRSKDRVTGFKGSPIPLSVFDHRLAGGIRTGIGRRSKRRYIVKSESSVNTRQFSTVILEVLRVRRQVTESAAACATVGPGQIVK
jgi:hypothetical protein